MNIMVDIEPLVTDSDTMILTMGTIPFTNETTKPFRQNTTNHTHANENYGIFSEKPSRSNHSRHQCDDHIQHDTPCRVVLTDVRARRNCYPAKHRIKTNSLNKTTNYELFFARAARIFPVLIYPVNSILAGHT